MKSPNNHYFAGLSLKVTPHFLGSFQPIFLEKKNDFHFSWCHTIPSEHDAVIEIYEDVPTCSNNLKMALSENRAPY